MEARHIEKFSEGEFRILDTVWCEISLQQKDNLIVGVCYRSPNSTENYCELLNKQIKMVCETNPTHLCIMGDFNYKEINWEFSTVEGPINSQARVFYENIQDLFLCQHVTDKTRFRQGQNPSQLDLIFTSDEQMIECVDILSPLGKSDHACLLWKQICYRDIKKQTHEGNMLNYCKANFKKIREMMNGVDWNKKFADVNIQVAWRMFCSEYNDAVRSCVPVKKVKVNKRPPWLKAHVKKALRAKYKTWAIYKRTSRITDYQKFKEQRNATDKIVKTAQRNYEKSLISVFKSEPKKLYSYLSGKMKVKKGVSQLDQGSGVFTQSDKEVADVLNEYFTSVYTHEPTGSLPDFEYLVDERNFVTDLIITEQVVHKKLRNLKENKAPGPDNLHPLILKECCDVFAKPLYLLYRKSLDEGELPLDWKEANVTPIHKKGSKTVPGNYRAVSLTSIPCKILEDLVREEIQRHLEKNNLMNQNQHGFVQGKSCFTNLLETLEDITASIDEGSEIDMIYLDFSKAFVSVPYRRLLKKLEAHGIKGKILSWIKDFLIGRKQQVVVNGIKSKKSDVISGVPQGSVLGPSLFVLYITDIDIGIRSNIQKFADDTKIYRQIDSEGDIKILQEDLIKLEEWSKKWLLKFNVDKCKTTHFGHANPEFSYELNGKKLDRSSEENDFIVVIVCDTLHPSVQCAKAANRAMSALGVVKKCFKHLDEESLPVLYKAYIRPHMETCVQAWSPYYKRDIEVLEKIQRRTTKLVPSLKQLPYEERLSRLNLMPLEERRLRGDLIETYKILKGIDKVNQAKFFKLTQEHRTRGHELKIFKPRLKKGLLLRKNFFSVRVVNAWNSLPRFVIESNTLNQFKINLSKCNAWKGLL